jgi:hypothetical protein
MLKLRERQEKKSRLFWYNLFRLGTIKFNNPCDLENNFKMKPIGFEENEDGTLTIADRMYIKNSASPSIIMIGELKLNALLNKIDIPEYVPRDFVLKISFKPIIYYPYDKYKNRYEYMKSNANELLESSLKYAKNYKKSAGYTNNLELIPGYRGISILENYPDTSLIYESRLYKQIINNLIEKRFTPNVLLYVTSFRCKDILKTKFIKEDKYMQRTIISILQQNRSKFDINRANILILERGKGKTLDKFLRQNVNKRNFVENMKKILIQCLYTLEVFSQVDLQHQDSHFQNIWIEKLDDVKPIYYFYDKNKCMNINLEWMIKFFDWDRGYSEELNKEGLINGKATGSYCYSYAQCNNKQKLLDLTKFLCYFHISIRNAVIWKLINNEEYEEFRKFYLRILKGDERIFSLLTNYAPNYYCLLCDNINEILNEEVMNKVVSVYFETSEKGKIDTYDYCNTKKIFDDMLNNSKIMSIPEMLDDKMFDNYRVSVENIPIEELEKKEELYYLPSLESEISTIEEEIRKTIMTSNKKRVSEPIQQKKRMKLIDNNAVSMIKSEKSKVQENVKNFINLQKSNIGFTDSDREESKNFENQLIEILNENIKQNDKNMKVFELIDSWKDIIKEKRVTEKEEKEEKGYFRTIYDWIF